jgi:hypothetical protein
VTLTGKLVARRDTGATLGGTTAPQKQNELVLPLPAGR